MEGRAGVRWVCGTWPAKKGRRGYISGVIVVLVFKKPCACIQKTVRELRVLNSVLERAGVWRGGSVGFGESGMTRSCMHTEEGHPVVVHDGIKR